LTSWFRRTFLSISSFILLLINSLFSNYSLWYTQSWYWHWHTQHYSIFIILTLVAINISKLHQILACWCLTPPVPLKTRTTEIINRKRMLQTHNKLFRPSEVSLRCFLTNINCSSLWRNTLFSWTLLFLKIKRNYLRTLEWIIFIYYLMRGCWWLLDFKVLHLHAVPHVLTVYKQDVSACLNISGFIIVGIKLATFPRWLAINYALPDQTIVAGLAYSTIALIELKLVGVTFIRCKFTNQLVLWHWLWAVLINVLNLLALGHFQL
jgi:hypothetical protein